ncbi:uncharacterized protein CLUP02_01175 [Colletotrichum lupini]|uniref:Uncharacterized protein n=1 Tax=Colletotrichum lupini TaxID=145971 RepID=A0A9Q8SBV5_9PEZI|nr:uncharacterized protein CLUP02_01175 [Colletotrichum lupini]UQC74524.1 hypothetical protein CLUP02_01175 [Colletotrichum lupini]
MPMQSLLFAGALLTPMNPQYYKACWDFSNKPPDYSGTAWARPGRFSATNPTSFPEDPQPNDSQGPEPRPGQPSPGTHRCREKVPDSVFQTVPGAGHCQGFIHSVIQIASRVDDTPRIVHA